MKGNYQFVPAALAATLNAGTGIYVKYTSYKSGKVKILSQSPNHVHVLAPDRELFITSGSNRADTIYPYGEWDNYVHLGTFDPHINPLQTKYTMVNYVSALEGNPVNDHKCYDLNGTKSITGDLDNYDDLDSQVIISDSGGYQVFTGAIDYLDPIEIVKWYNDNADIGIILDIPSTCYTTSLIKKLGNLQKRNTESMLEHKRDSLSLMNVVHGLNSDQRKLFSSLCETPEINRMAVGGIYRGTLMDTVKTLYDYITGCKQTYRHYHILGVSNALQVLMLQRMAANGAAELITSDSSAHIRESQNRKYRYFTHLSEPIKIIRLGNQKGEGAMPLSTMQLPCTCPACSTIKYTDILAYLGGSVMNAVFSFHNQYCMTNYFNITNEVMQNGSLSEAKSLIRFHYKNSKRGGLQETLHALDFIDSVKTAGFSPTLVKYKYFSTEGSHKLAPKTDVLKSLFTSNGEANVETRNMSNDKKSSIDEDQITRMEGIVSNYETKETKHGSASGKNKMAAGGHSAKSTKKPKSKGKGKK